MHSLRAGSGADRALGRLAVVERPVSSLRPDPRNPRKHDKKQVRRIADSIVAFGFNVPVLVDENLKVIAGHGRLEASKLLGRETVPTISLEHLSPEQAKAFRIADNRLTDTSVWDERLLAEELKALSAVDLDFALEAIGFDMAEIDLRIESLGEPPPENDPADALPPAGPPVSRPGDLWLLGDHRIFCGSALEEASYETLLAEERAALVFSDPPYNVPIAGNVSGLGAIRHREFAMASGEMSPEEFVEFLTRACRLFARYSAEGSLHYLCMDWRHLREIGEAGRAAYTEIKNLCVWVKDNAGMGSLYRSQHELVFVFKSGNAPHRNNVRLGMYGRNRTNVWRYPAVNRFGRGTEEGNLLALHPTVKPVALVADAIRDASGRGDIVLDGFLGSGSTLIAAERTGRRCYGIELDPVYVDTAIRRWRKLTGREARNAANGLAFAEEAAAEVKEAA